MAVVRRIAVSLIGVILMFAVAACQSTPATEVTQAANRSAGSTPSETPTSPQSDAMVWGRVPYCNCFAESATANVAGALKTANLTVSLQELSQRDGWLYFAVTFDPHSATGDQVGAAMVAGGGEVLEGPP